ncbi:MAG: hypothetical protein LBR65_07085 [Culturomica sp.]|nr:hypothetical protein [Culturomica sp.]
MKTTLLLIFIGAFFVSGKSQSFTTQDSLMAFKWELYTDAHFENDISVVLSYNSTIETETTVYDDGETEVNNSSYYLSYSIDLQFDTNKIGTSKNGRYLVICRMDKKAVCYKIAALTNQKLILIHVESPNAVTEWIAREKYGS